MTEFSISLRYIYALPAHYAAVWLVGRKLVFAEYGNRPCIWSWSALMDKTIEVWSRDD